MEISKNILLQVQAIIQKSQENAVRSLNFERVLMDWQIGQIIFEGEQQGRADYGTYLIKTLTEHLQAQFGSGFSKRQLYSCLQLYKVFPNVNALRTQLNWAQYRPLISIDQNEKRQFHIAEATKNNWKNNASRYSL